MPESSRPTDRSGTPDPSLTPGVPGAPASPTSHPPLSPTVPAAPNQAATLTPHSRPRPGRLLADIVAAGVAWLVIAAATTAIIVETAKSKEPGGEQAAGASSDAVMEFQAKSMMAISELFRSLGSPQTKQQFGGDLQVLNSGGVDQRLRFIVLEGEYNGGERALTRLEELEMGLQARDVVPTSDQQIAMELLEKNYETTTVGSGMTAADRARLIQLMGWFGELATTPEGSPDRDAFVAPLVRAAIVLSLGFFILGIAGLAGIAGLCVLLVKALGGTLRAGLTPGGGRESVYAETFAVWIVLLLTLPLALHVMLDDRVPEGSLLPGGLGLMLSLFAIAWPRIRGLPWSQIRRDIGWVGGRWGVFEPFAGVATYAMSLPLLAVGILLMLVLAATFGGVTGIGGGDPNSFDQAGGVEHPIIGGVSRGDVWVVLQLMFLAVIVAPIVEETMFRGVLYRHIRAATHGGGTVLSILAGALVNSLIFAAIHPQGWIAIPALSSLAIGFTLGREWRNSLIAPMVAHGLNNGLVMSMMLLFLSS